MEDLRSRLQIEYKQVGILGERLQAYCVKKITSQAKGKTVHGHGAIYGIETAAVTKMQESKMSVTEKKVLCFS